MNEEVHTLEVTSEDGTEIKVPYVYRDGDPTPDPAYVSVFVGGEAVEYGPGQWIKAVHVGRVEKPGEAAADAGGYEKAAEDYYGQAA